MAFCDALGIVKPIAYGASFGGMVLMIYATRHPEYAGKLVLVSTSAQATSHTDAKIAMRTWHGGWVVPQRVSCRVAGLSKAAPARRCSRRGLKSRSRSTRRRG